MLLLAFFTSILASPPMTHAFPEMVRHNYVNCNACHVSPAGGGLLNEYGRMTAAEVLSSWGSPEEAMFLFGAPDPSKLTKALNLGGDVRVLQVHREDRAVREGRFIPMQASIEGALTIGPITAVGSFLRPKRDRSFAKEFTRYYLMGNVLESLQVRAGHFVPSFGLNVPYHTVVTRDRLGFGMESERDTAEAHWSGELWHGAVSVSESRADSRVAEKEKGISGQAEIFFADSHRLGASVWRGESERQKRVLAGAHGLFGFTHSLYWLTEMTVQSKRGKVARGADRETGIFHFSRLGYELTKGLHALALEEFAKTDLSRPSTQFQSVGVGGLWYPRPHLELELTFNQRRSFQFSPEWEDYAYLLVHFYL